MPLFALHCCVLRGVRRTLLAMQCKLRPDWTARAASRPRPRPRPQGNASANANAVPPDTDLCGQFGSFCEDGQLVTLNAQGGRAHKRGVQAGAC